MSKKFRCQREDCMYRAGQGEDRTHDFVNACNYFFLTGKSRIAQLPPELRDPAKCPMYIPREGGKVHMNRRITAPVWEPLALKMYKEGRSDREIAAAVGVSPTTIGTWRVKRKLKSIWVMPKRYGSFDTQKALELYKQGKNDGEISVAVGVSRQTIGTWRHELGLPPHAAGPGVVYKYDWDKALTLYDKGCTDEQIAKALGCKPDTVYKWRRRESLPTKYKITKED